MSLKDHGEDKAVEAPVMMPRELRNLLDAIQELSQAVASKRKDRAAALAEEVERLWAQVNRIQLAISAQGGNMPLLESCADALNAAQEAKGRAYGLLNGLGSGS